MKNLQEQVKKAFCSKNCCRDLKKFVNSWSSASNFIYFFDPKHLFLTVYQTNFGNKSPIFPPQSDQTNKIVGIKIVNTDTVPEEYKKWIRHDLALINVTVELIPSQ